MQHVTQMPATPVTVATSPTVTTRNSDVCENYSSPQALLTGVLQVSGQVVGACVCMLSEK